ncbi:PH domain-containing protein [Gimesia benthica]|uniref:PH domain-containing protein n=1 Tax=Gimesia benthica TaxID=2608982 RepID=A0A6I6A6P9_9PLAN|nr:PH domain-containing protein [Gimesia benthica]QGQ22037.1 PH domain-containing protein [Gimesia benthica]
MKNAEKTIYCSSDFRGTAAKWRFSMVTIIPSTLSKRLKVLLVGNLLMVFGILCISIGLLGVGSWTVVACLSAVSVSILLQLVAMIRGRPRVIVTEDGFVFEKLFQRDSWRWDDIEGQFIVISIGWDKFVGYKLKPEILALSGRKSMSAWSGCHGIVGGNTLAGTTEELADLLNKVKDR